MALLDASQIRYVNPNRRGSGVVHVGAADWGWGPSDATQTRLRIEIRERYEQWSAAFRSLLPDPPPDLLAEIEEADGLVRRWLERDKRFDHSVPRTTDEAKARLSEELERLRRVIAVIVGDTPGRLIAIPDTNALIDWPELDGYEEVLGTDTYAICLLATVTGELDGLKSSAPRDLRERVRAVSRRLAEYRRRGSLLEGVPLAGARTLFAVAQEPRRELAPGWCDFSVADDRIIAGALELQGREPSSAVVLISSDLGAQQKAELARLPVLEPPAHAGAWRRAGRSGPQPALRVSLAPGYQASERKVRVTANVSNDGDGTAHGVLVVGRLDDQQVASGELVLLGPRSAETVRLDIPRDRLEGVALRQLAQKVSLTVSHTDAR